MSVTYRKPFPDTIKTKVASPKGAAYAHESYPESKFAIDFLMDVDSPVLAARGGIVIAVKDDSDEWGIDLSFAQSANYVGINHGDGTYAEYLHLGKEKVVVKKGQNIAQGQLLGYTGLSGCMDLPHLHFNLFRVENGKGISIPVAFGNL